MMDGNILMGNQQKTIVVDGEFFNWRLRKRKDIWYADGRGNRPNPGRHSLDTSDLDAARQNLRQLDLLRAVDLGLAEPSRLVATAATILNLEEGVKAYMTFLRRPKIAGGPSAASPKRYKPVFDKFLPYLKENGIHCWNYVKRHQLDSYAAWLDDQNYAYRTEFLELTTIKQAINYLIEAELLPPDCKIHLRLRKPSGTDTYCYSEEQFGKMLQHCAGAPELTWLEDVFVVLGSTGLRISELSDLRATDVDLGKNIILLPDQRYQKRLAGGTVRTTKGKRSRVLPIVPNLKPVLVKLIAKSGTGALLRGPKGAKLRPDHVRNCLKRDVLKPLEPLFPSGADEIGFKDGRLHSFRHFFCSLCAHRGIPEPTVMQWLGHGSSAMVRHYYHLNDQESQRQIAKVNVDWRAATAGETPLQ